MITECTAEKLEHGAALKASLIICLWQAETGYCREFLSQQTQLNQEGFLSEVSLINVMVQGPSQPGFMATQCISDVSEHLHLHTQCHLASPSTRNAAALQHPAS